MTSCKAEFTLPMARREVITNERFESGYKPYIIWQYDPDPNIRVRNGNFAVFDFVDRQGGGNYFLVSSNAIGESYDR